MAIPDVVKRFAINFGVGIAVRAVRGFLNEKMKDITPSDLYEAIMNNQDLWSVTPDDMKSTGMRFKGRFHDLFVEHQHEINTQLLMKWMHEDHLDLFSTIINTPGGVEWFDRQVYLIKQKIMEM